MLENRFQDIEMPEFLRKALDEFLEVRDDPAKQRLMDCYGDELEGSIKACAAWGSIPRKVVDEMMRTYLERPWMDYRSFLEEIAPYVVVVGSFGRGEEHDGSDVDCFLRSRPRDELNENMDNETYMEEVIEIVKRYQVEWSSVIMGHVAVERQYGFPRMIEISSMYKIPHTNEVHYRDVDGVQMMCAVDDKEATYEECFDHADWDDKLQDMVIAHPLPAFAPFENMLQSALERSDCRQSNVRTELEREPPV